jgi:hypothetical protein
MRVLYKSGRFIQGRAVHDFIRPKYLNTSGAETKPVVFFSGTGPFAYPVLVEGLYDALSLVSVCKTVLTGFGSKLSDGAIMTIKERLEGDWLVVWYDLDAAKDALALQERLPNLIIMPVFTLQDPNSLGTVEARSVLKSHFPSGENDVNNAA